MAKGNSLAQRLLKTSTIPEANILTDSDIYQKKDIVQTPVPALNIAFSGSIYGGLMPGLTVFAGPSKHFKTMYALICAASYMMKYPDAVCLFYDSEFGSPADYFKSVGIDPDRVIHSPIMNWEDLITDAANQLKEIKRGDRVVIIVDSVGNLASAKEIKDAEDGSEKADLTRARRAKSFFRIATPHLRMKDIPMIVVAHTYDTLELYSKKVVSGGTGIYYSADNIFIIGREQESEGTGAKKERTGFTFKINIEKSRYVEEKKMIPITVKFDGGVERYSGLFDIASDLGFIGREGNSKTYYLTNVATGELDEKYSEFARKDVEHNAKFWKHVFGTLPFDEHVQQEFKISSGQLIQDEVDEMEVGNDE